MNAICSKKKLQGCSPVIDESDFVLNFFYQSSLSSALSADGKPGKMMESMIVLFLVISYGMYSLGGIPR